MTMLEVLIDISWERLNCGTWKYVPIDWRYLYGYGSFFKAILIINKSFNKKEKLKALYSLDMGLLMSPPIGNDNVLSKFASIIHKDIVECDVSSDGVGRLIEDGRPPRKLIKIDQCRDKIVRVRDVDLEQFKYIYMNDKTPVILENVMSHWAALSDRKWSLNYLLSVGGHRTVPIEIGSKYTDAQWSQKLITLRQFINDYIINSAKTDHIGYLAQHNLFDQIEELRHDISIPDYCAISQSDTDDIDVDMNAWFGPSGTVSPLHYDVKDNLLCQVKGSKYIRLYSDETPVEYIYPYDTYLLSNTSQVDVENVDSEKFPLFNQAQYYDCQLHEGEMLYIPKKFWHYVRSITTSFSISFWWQ